ncbi:MAG TPA: hypothetical protein VGL33_31195, partial [Streptosporangiaceae bacterium]
LDQDQAAGEPPGVGDVQRGGVVRLPGQAERRIAVGAQGAVGVVADPPRLNGSSSRARTCTG